MRNLLEFTFSLGILLFFLEGSKFDDMLLFQPEKNRLFHPPHKRMIKISSFIAFVIVKLELISTTKPQASILFSFSLLHMEDDKKCSSTNFSGNSNQNVHSWSWVSIFKFESYI